MLKGFLISLALLAVLGLGGFITYNVAYGMGETTGYDNGYSVGQEAGYSLGEQGGYDEGYELGKEEGYTSGKTDGYNEGVEASLGHGYTLRDPTYAQAAAFITEDRTNENPYIEDTYGVYVCSHFARDVCNNAEGEGLRCAFVDLRYPDSAHAIIAFNTIDAGLVYFEPQSDEIVRPVVGKRFYQCVEPRPGYYYVPPSFDDTIMDILVIW